MSPGFITVFPVSLISLVNLVLIPNMIRVFHNNHKYHIPHGLYSARSLRDLCPVQTTHRYNGPLYNKTYCTTPRNGLMYDDIYRWVLIFACNRYILCYYGTICVILSCMVHSLSLEIIIVSVLVMSNWSLQPKTRPCEIYRSIKSIR